jgi:NhaP-type Na+/H+ and K+/H+ antiporter
VQVAYLRLQKLEMALNKPIDPLVKDTSWPEHFVIASFRRGTQVIIPEEDTTLFTGDILNVLMGVLSIPRLCSIIKKHFIGLA